MATFGDMRGRLRLLINTICSFLLAACSATDAQQVLLNRADSLMQVRPDSALMYLKSLSSADITSPAAQARYAVLITQALDKNSICHTHDSTIRSAVKYFDSVGDVPMQAKAHFYLGRVLQDKKERMEAAKEYWEAEALAEKAKDTELLSLTLDNLGYLYLWENLYDKADSLYLRAESLAVCRKDTLHLASILTMRGRICIKKGTSNIEIREEAYSKAKCYLEQALEIGGKTKNFKLENNILMHLGILYDKMGEESQAVHFLRNGMLASDDKMVHYAYCLTLGDFYYRSAQYDSARYYYGKCLDSENYYTKADVAMRLSALAMRVKDVNKALYWEQLHANYKDSIIYAEGPLNMIMVEHRLRLRQNEQQYKSGISFYNFLLEFFVLLIVVWVILWWRKRVKLQRKVAALQADKAHMQQAVMEQVRDAQKQLREKETELQTLQEFFDEYEEKKKEIELMHVQLEALYTQRHEILMNYLADSKDYMRLMAFIRKERTLKSPLPYDRAGLTALVTEIDKASSGFSSQLAAKYPSLNKEDVYFCCLIKIGISYSDIALVVARTTNAMYKRRTAILEKMKSECKEADVSLEEILWRI